MKLYVYDNFGQVVTGIPKPSLGDLSCKEFPRAAQQLRRNCNELAKRCKELPRSSKRQVFKKSSVLLEIVM